VSQRLCMVLYKTAFRYECYTAYIFLTGFFCGWPIGVEFFVGLFERLHCRQRNFQTTPEDDTVCNILVHTAC